VGVVAAVVVPVGAPNVSYPAARAHDWVALVSSVEANASCENCADPLDRSAKTRPYPYVNDAASVPCWGGPGSAYCRT
jgi:hypothetical protein